MLRNTLFVLAAGCSLLSAQGPAPDAILDRFVEATGGKEAYAALRSQVSTGRIEIVGQGVSGALTLTVDGDRSLMVFDLGQMGAIKTGSGGGHAWQTSPMQGARLLEGDEKVQTLRATRLDAPARWRELFTAVKYVGEDTSGGKACLQVEMTPQGASRPETNCYDKESGLLLRTRSTLVSPMGELAIETSLGDYRKVDKLLMPHRMEQKLGPQTIVTTFDQVRLNVPVESATLATPTDIQALIAKTK